LDHIHMADSIGIGWRNESYLGGAFDHIRVAACVGILKQAVDVIIRLRKTHNSVILNFIFPLPIYSIIRIVDEAPVITHVTVRIYSSESECNVSIWEFRMISEDDNGDVIPPTIPGGRWQIIWLQQKPQ
jgi:hypothetical protein